MTNESRFAVAASGGKHQCKLTRSIDEMKHCANSSFHLMMVVYNMRGLSAVIFSDYIKPIN